MRPTTEQLAIINSRLPGTKVTADQVDVLPFMAFDQKLTDRYTEMTPEMMRKIELDMNEGRVAFNALHRSQTTLPVGRSVNARIVGTELQVNMYAVHTRPDGTPFVDAKELVDKYNTGAVYACSLGVEVGLYKCNICGNDIRDWQHCEHIPGRTYAVNEQPKLCIAYMTGRDIQDGIAMDCGSYELSGVTAGGVKKAGVLTETFGKYEADADPAEFKKAAFEEHKVIDSHITFVANTTVNSNEEEPKMQKDEIKALVEEYTKSTVADKIKAETTLAALQVEFDKVTAAGTTLKAEFDKVTEELGKLKEAYATLETTNADHQKAIEGLETFKAEFLAVVAAKGVAAGKNVEEAEYAKMDLETLKNTYKGYCDEINALPVGQQSTDKTSDQAPVYSAIPDSCFKA